MNSATRVGQVLVVVFLLAGIGIARRAVVTMPDREVTLYRVEAPIPLPVKSGDDVVLGAVPIGGLVEEFGERDRGPGGMWPVSAGMAGFSVPSLYPWAPVWPATKQHWLHHRRGRWHRGRDKDRSAERVDTK